MTMHTYLGTKSSRTILLPAVIIRSVQNQIRPASKRRLQARDRRIVVLLGGHRQIVGTALIRPSTFRDYNRLAAGGFGDLLHPAFDEVACSGGEGVSVEEGVAVDGAEVRSGAELRVGFHGHHGIDGDDGAAVSGRCQRGPGCSDRRRDLSDRSSSAVDELVAHVDRVHESPISIDG